MPDLNLVTTISTLLNDYKAQNIDILPISTISDFADTMIICTATSTRHCQSIYKKLVDDLLARGVKPYNRHNASDSRWVLLDYSDIVVHIMIEEARQFYQLEKLWTDIDQAVAAEG